MPDGKEKKNYTILMYNMFRKRTPFKKDIFFLPNIVFSFLYWMLIRETLLTLCYIRSNPLKSFYTYIFTSCEFPNYNFPLAGRKLEWLCFVFYERWNRNETINGKNVFEVFVVFYLHYTYMNAHFSFSKNFKWICVLPAESEGIAITFYIL